MTIQSLAEHLERSNGYVSQIERGLSQPTLKDLYVISSLFEVPISWFLPEGSGDREVDGEREYIVRAGHRRKIEQNGVTTELLTPDPDHRVEFMISTFEPGAETEIKSIRVQGTERGFVLRGALELHIEGKRFTLKEGDSYQFERSSNYWSRNLSAEEPVIILWIATP